MVRIIDVCSGKGGVGKTTIAANLGVALQSLGKKVVVVDCNLTTSHLSFLFGDFSHDKTINNFLRNECRLEDAICTHRSGLKFVPASAELSDLINVDVDDLKGKLNEAFRDFDFVLLDSAPGLGREALVPLLAADEILFVANPYIPSLADIVKCNKLLLSIESGQSVLGVILNRVRKKKYEISVEETRQFTELPVIGTIPEDENVLECTNKRNLLVFAKKDAPASRAISGIAAKLCNENRFSERATIFQRLFSFFKRDSYQKEYLP
jgi:septum site-determining protein MinD